MTEPLSPRRSRRPQKVATDPARADEVLAALRESELEIRRIEQQRRRLMVEASDLGLTTTKIGEAAGASQTAVSRWVREAREQQKSDR